MPRENARGKREKTPSRIPSPSDLPRHRHASISAVDLFHRRTELWKEGSECDGRERHLPPLFPRQIRVTATNCRCSGCRKPPPSLCLLVRPSEFLAAVGDAAGSSRDCGCSILLLLIELSGLPVAIKVVSAIVEVSRPAIEAAVGFRRRGMVLVTPLVYGFNFRALSFQEPDGEALRRVILRLVYMLLY
ncbi:uncharacterized protein LOC130946834 isoform X3 [Arachis stenosperma]|uniref:uncharacterized protein LOC130946834 isoform X3 n=1 Tax=Arachis stenosperma TaxID=217475 RepID=UPI0025AD7735|nr:uncharacterized protein LOC130946834 isoform X3 [Arachis stenosperma]